MANLSNVKKVQTAIAEMVDIVDDLKREQAECLEMCEKQTALLSDILNEVNRDYAHGGPSRLSEALIQRIEEILEV